METKNPGTCDNCQKLVPVRHDTAFSQGGVALSGLWCTDCVRGMLPKQAQTFFPKDEGWTIQ